MLPARAFGNSGIAVSPLIFGSMRLDPQKLSANETMRLLEFLANSGVTGWHSSHEYANHASFCATLRSLKLQAPVHIMKLGEPHFDVPRFRRERFIALVEQELRALGTERIAVVQWLLRTTPNDDATRLPLLKACIDEVEETAQSLIAQGKIGALAVFPYTEVTAVFCLPRPQCAGLVTYLNPAEREYVPFLSDLQQRGQGMIAIRPLCGGKLLDASLPEGHAYVQLCEKLHVPPQDRAGFALRWPLLHPAVSGVIVSVSSMEHAKQAVDALTGIRPDIATFNQS